MNQAEMSMIPGEAHVWYMVLDHVPLDAYHHWSDLLDDAERAAAARFYHDIDRQQYIAAHALLRTMLFRCTGLSPSAWRFVTGAKGKPAVHPDIPHPRLQFNLSHTRGAVACAVTLDHPIGIDVENIKRPTYNSDIA